MMEFHPHLIDSVPPMGKPDLRRDDRCHLVMIVLPGRHHALPRLPLPPALPLPLPPRLLSHLPLLLLVLMLNLVPSVPKVHPILTLAMLRYLTPFSCR